MNPIIDYRLKMSFIGQFPVRLDAKNRAFMPAGFRRLIQQAGEQTLVVRKDYFENCLVVYPATQWRDEIAEKAQYKLPCATKIVRKEVSATPEVKEAK